VKPLTRELAEEFRNLEASPTERALDESRVKHLREKAEAGQLVTFNWSTAKLGGRKLRMNGMHSSTMLCGLNGNFPKNLKVHLDTYEVDSPEALAILFRRRAAPDGAAPHRRRWNGRHERRFKSRCAVKVARSSA
jgi:hypothetical protein